MRRSIPIAAAVAMAVPAVVGTAADATSTKTYRGTATRMYYGPVQVTIMVTGTRITNVIGHAPMNHPRSKQINSHAVPILDREALTAQSARGVHRVSGASLTWRAFKVSLANAMSKAHLPGA